MKDAYVKIECHQEKDHDIWTGKGMAVELQKAFKAGA